MIVFPNAKINLGLRVVSKRTDGFHNLESVFYPVPWHDALEILPSDKFTFSSSGIAIAGELTSNLCYRAYRRFQEDYQLPEMQMHLHKNIPIGAGLGGGSADAAFTVKALNAIFNLNLTEDELENAVRPLGSDCAFFIRNQPVLALEKGDIFKPIQLSLKGTYILLVYPNVFISTQEAYAGIVAARPGDNLEDIIRDLSQWKEKLKNDFEPALFLKNPILYQVKQQLYEMGAFYASMSGSGSTLYGLFEQPIDTMPNFPAEYSICQGVLS